MEELKKEIKELKKEVAELKLELNLVRNATNFHGSVLHSLTLAETLKK